MSFIEDLQIGRADDVLLHFQVQGRAGDETFYAYVYYDRNEHDFYIDRLFIPRVAKIERPIYSPSDVSSDKYLFDVVFTVFNVLHDYILKHIKFYEYPVRIFPGEEATLGKKRYFAEYIFRGNHVIEEITEDEFELYRSRGVPVTGWYVERKKPRQTTLFEFI